MTFIKAPLADGGEEVAPPESMYDLRIASKKVGRNAADTRDQVHLYIVIEGHEEEDYMGINHWLTFPNEEDLLEFKEKAKIMLRSTNRFLTVFGVNYGADGFDEEDLDGATGSCMVYLEKRKDADGNEMDEEQPRLRLPRMAMS